MAESTDVSNTTIAILIILVILISAVGTWTVLNSVKSTTGSDGVLVTAKQAEIRLVGASVLEQQETEGAASGMGGKP